MNEKIRNAWLAGFLASENGLNGENPCYRMPQEQVIDLVGKKLDAYMLTNGDVNPPVAAVEQPANPFIMAKRGPGRPKGS